MTETEGCGCGAEPPASRIGGGGSPHDDGAGQTGDPEAPHQYGASHEGESIELDVRAEPFGPDQTQVDQAMRALLAHPRVVQLAAPADSRLLSFRLVHEGESSDGSCRSDKPGAGCPPDRFVATLYDYAESRVLEVRGPLHALDAQVPGPLSMRVLGHQPLPSGEEFAAAVEIVRHDREIRERLDRGELSVYRPMPPFVERQLPDGRTERTLAVGLRVTRDETPFHQLVGVSMFDRRVIREDLTGIVQAGERVCEPPPNRDPYVGGGGLSGQCWVTVISGGQTIWRLLAVRPGASSGTNGSGIELKYVDYRGKRVLYHGHVPILNVEYGTDGRAIRCGPTYRDWQNAETPFEATGTAVAPGFVLCPQPARTIIDNNTDAGNFAGVAIFVDGPEVVLVSEMQAGWYRYVSEWRLHANGRIRPRFGFAGTENRCTCNLHTHHVYWRLDFDIRTPGHNVVEEFNDPPLVGSSNWHAKQFEIRRPRDAAHQRRWRVRNTMSREAYEIVPGAQDGSTTAYGLGDVWVLRYHPGELDDGQGFTTDPNLSRARLEPFMSPPESVSDTDVVVWYAGHYVHDASHEVGHWVGPDLIPSGW
jgi:hypothetical protein